MAAGAHGSTVDLPGPDGIPKGAHRLLAKHLVKVQVQDRHASFSRKANVSVCRRVLKAVLEDDPASAWFDDPVTEEEYPGAFVV